MKYLCYLLWIRISRVLGCTVFNQIRLSRHKKLLAATEAEFGTTQHMWLLPEQDCGSWSDFIQDTSMPVGSQPCVLMYLVA